MECKVVRVFFCSEVLLFLSIHTNWNELEVLQIIMLNK